MTIKVKLCGFTNKETVDLAASLAIDFLGVVFCNSSPRNTSPSNAYIITADLPSNIKKVAVMVNPDINQLDKVVNEFRPDFLQLHGENTVQELGHIKDLFGLPIIKGIPISSKDDLKIVTKFEQITDIFLFDRKIKNIYGGTGLTFDWKILQDLQMKKDWFLAGGLNVNNIEEALRITAAKMIDISSGIEEIKGVKSKQKIIEFMNKINDLRKNVD